MPWAIRFIGQAEVEERYDDYKHFLPLKLLTKSLAPQVPEAIDLTAYCAQLTTDKKRDRIVVAQAGGDINLPSPIVDQDHQGYFQVIGDQLWYKDGPVGDSSENGTGLLVPKVENNAYIWEGTKWSDLKNLFISIPTHQVYMLFPRKFLNMPAVPNYLAHVYLFQLQQPAQAQAQVEAQTIQQP